MGQKLPPRAGQARRRELGQCSTPRRAARDGPEGWEKPPGRLGWTGEFRGQPSPAGGRGGERCPQGCGRGGAAARGWGERARRRSPLFRLAQVGRGRPGWRGRPESVAVGLRRRWSCGSAQTLARPAARRVHTHAHSPSARPGLRGRRDGTSLPARGLGPKEGDGLPHAAAGPTRAPPPLGPLTRTRRRAPRRALELEAAPRWLWGRRERPQSKGSSKEKAKEEQGPRVQTRLEGGPEGGALKGLRRLRGSRVAFGLSPRARGSPSLPFPGSQLPLWVAPSSTPRALYAAARGSVLGIKRKEGGGKGRGREGAEEKGGRSLRRRVLSFSSGPSGQTARPLPGPLPGASCSRRRGRPPVVW